MSTKHIYTGLSTEEKAVKIREYLDENKDIKHVVYFRPKFMPEMEDIEGVEVESYTWDEAILYRCFYPLLDKIDHSYMIIMDEMMRTQKRNDLTYNCLHHYVNQTESVVVFETFPMISEPQDFMILVDMVHPYIFKGQQFSPEILKKEFVHIKPVHISLDSVEVPVSDEIRKAYEEEKETLFASVEENGKDPDTIPRTLHVWAGTKVKKPYVKDGCVARNKRLKCETYKDQIQADEKTIVDFPTKQIYFNDYVKATGARTFHFLNTGLSVDKIYAGQYQGWIDTLEEVFYSD